MIHEYGVYIPGAAPPDERSIDGLCRAADLSNIDARMLLTSPLPKRVISERTAADAAARVRALREAGLDAFVVTRDALRRAKPVRLKTGRFEGGAFRGEASFEPGSLRLIVVGEIQTRSKVVRTVHVQDDGPPRTERLTEDRRSSAERFIHLYGEGHATCAEIRPQGFNFRALVPVFGPTLSGNVAAFLDRLREVFPGVLYDDTLLRFPPIPDDQGSTGSEDRKVEVEGNEAAAMRTSTLIALDLLRR